MVKGKKVVLLGETIVDLTDTTAVASDVAQGKYFYNADGVKTEGTLAPSAGGPFAELVDRSISQVDPSDFGNATSIGWNAFSNCYNLTEIEIPGTIYEIERFAFNDCQALERVIIAEGVEGLGGSAFQNCYNLVEVDIPSTITYMDDPFGSCISLTTINYNGTKSDWENLVQNIYNFLGELTQTITVHCTNGDIVYNQPVGNMVVTFSSAAQMEPVEIPVTADIKRDLANLLVRAGVEVDLQYVRTVTFPEGVESICNDFASYYYGFSHLNSVTFPSTLEEIGDSAFYGTRLTNIDLPASIRRIGYDAFNGLNQYGAGISSFNVQMTCRAINPPYLDSELDVGENATLTAIYVPSESVQTYQQYPNWAQHASIIQAIPQV